MLLNLMPAAWRPYAKAVVSVVTALLAVAPQVIPALPAEWQPAVSAAVALVGSYLVYVTPNEPVKKTARILPVDPPAEPKG